ncbi:hypothetical protein A5647_24205 [Mycobacterium sp. 1100029.7]|nr:hypothetical protein A5647_24205 [Mycobacterium sp. 1100029.7]
MSAKLWVGAALSPYGNEYGLIAVVAETKDEAITKARNELSSGHSNHGHQQYQDYADALLENLDNISEIKEGIVIDWDAARRQL